MLSLSTLLVTCFAVVVVAAAVVVVAAAVVAAAVVVVATTLQPVVVIAHRCGNDGDKQGAIHRLQLETDALQKILL